MALAMCRRTTQVSRHILLQKMVTLAPLTLRMKKTKMQMRRTAKSLVTWPWWPIGALLYSGSSAHKSSNLRSYNVITCSRFSLSSATVSLLTEVAVIICWVLIWSRSLA